MALIRSQVQVKPDPAPDLRGRTSAAAAWLADDKYAWAAAVMLGVLYLTYVVPSALWSGEVHDLVANEPSFFYRALKAALIVSGAVVLTWRSALAAKLFRELNPFLPAVLALMLLSTGWSIEPGITLWRAVLVCLTSLVCAAFVLVGWHPRRLQEVMRPLLTAFLVASLIFGALEPNLGREFEQTFALAGAWRGIFAQKNGLGFGAAMCAILWLHGWLAKEVRFWRFAAGVTICIACMILSRSSTAIFATIFATFLLLLLMKGFSGRRRYVVPLTVLFVAVVLFYSLVVLKIVPDMDFLLEPIVAVSGKDMTFTGRTQIWDVVREHISQHPLLGTGYGAYWIGPLPRSPSILTMARYSDYYPSEAHNGYLDVINDLGYVGLVCLLGYILVYLRQSLVLLRTDYNQAVLYLVVLFNALITNLSNSDWLSYMSPGFALTILVVFALARAALDRRLRATLPVQPNPLPMPRVIVGRSP